ncbi:MAG TPA: hypothetical protein V6C90_08395 [Coleofasciculaceae cyanobacterium]
MGMERGDRATEKLFHKSDRSISSSPYIETVKKCEVSQPNWMSSSGKERSRQRAIA